MQTQSVTTKPDALTVDAVRATMYADQAMADAEAERQGDEPDTLEQACGHEAFFILDRYERNEGWDTTGEQIETLHDEIKRAGIAAARGAMIELAAHRLAGTRRIEA
jgi:hypothetical protein